jgi:hypothetical protein
MNAIIVMPVVILELLALAIVAAGGLLLVR